MKKVMSLMAVCILLGAAGSAAAQPVAGEREVGTKNPRASGATRDDIAEMPITDVLNRLSAQGYSQYRSIQRFGDIYRIDALTRDLRQVTLEVNARTGAITQVQ